MVTRIVVVPIDFPVTAPEASIVAIALLAEVHLTSWLVASAGITEA